MTAQDYTSPNSVRQYRKLFKVGRGGMGDVHLALSTGQGAFRKLVVLKCRRQPVDEENDRRGMFLEEGRLAALLNHPNIVQTYEVGQLEGTDYIAMEFLEGQPVSHLSAQVGGLAPRLVAYIAEQVLRGLHYAQELRDLDGTPLNIIHRDLSPENIFVTYDGAVKVLDFGIAKSDARSREVTEAGVLKGKLSYMAPEQVETFTADRRTDIFVLGMVMWELITGKRLNSHRSAVDQFRWLTEGKVPSLITTMNVDPELDAIVQTACQRKPQSRYATAHEMRHALEAFLARNGGGGAAEHLSRVMISHFGRVRDSMRVQVRQRIQELEQQTESDTSSPIDDSPDRPSAITYVVQNSDLFSGDDEYRNATTGRVAVAPRRAWAGWVAASCLGISCFVWFHYARTLGAESIVFRMLPQTAPIPASERPSAGAHSALGDAPFGVGPEDMPTVAQGMAGSDNNRPLVVIEPETAKSTRGIGDSESTISVPATSGSADDPTANRGRPLVNSNTTGAGAPSARVGPVFTSRVGQQASNATRANRGTPTRSGVDAATTSPPRQLHALQPQAPKLQGAQPPAPQVDSMLPSRVPMVN